MNQEDSNKCPGGMFGNSVVPNPENYNKKLGWLPVEVEEPYEKE